MDLGKITGNKVYYDPVNYITKGTQSANMGQLKD